MADEPNASAIDLRALGHKLRKEQEGSEERIAYLEKLRKQVKSGQYSVDAEALADKLLESAADEILPDHCPDDDEAK
jgi:anti-sigma28 factor (negative regulator of flagellin synthesis)